MILFLDQITEKNDCSVGGKALNLGKLVQIGMNVPNGFVLCSDIYEEYIKDNKIDEYIVKKITKINEKNCSIKNASEELKELFIKGEFTETVKVMIEKAYTKLGVSLPLAVRSSASAEDLNDSSFAGQLESYMNIKNKNELFSAIKNCYASLWSERAIKYRLDRGYDSYNQSMGVIVQEMIDSEKSGVLFTVNPATGNSDEIEINANYGLGESVVSGNVTADSYIVNKESKKIEVTLGDKKFKYVPSEHLIKRVEIEENEKNSKVLRDIEILKLSEIGIAIEKAYGYAMDIEWSIKNETIYIVQARAVTTQKKVDNSKIVNKYLTKLSLDSKTREMLSFIIEKLPFVLKPLEYDYIMQINSAKTKILEENGIIVNSMLNMDNRGIMYFNKVKKHINFRIFRLPLTLKRMKDFCYCSKRCKEFLQKAKEELVIIKSYDFENMNLNECRDFLIFGYNFLAELGYNRFKYAVIPSIKDRRIAKYLQKLNGNYPVFDLYNDLESRTIKISKGILDISRIIKSDSELKSEVLNGTSYSFLRSKYPLFKEKIDSFISLNGYKSDYNCYCIQGRSFIENPDMILDMVIPVILHEQNEKKNGKLYYREIMNSLKKIYGSKYPEIEKIIENFRYFHIVREETQYMWEEIFFYIRKCLERINFIMFKNKDYGKGIGNLFFFELLTAIDNGEIDEQYNQLIKERKKAVSIANEVWELSKSQIYAESSDRLEGISGNTGIAIGKACIVRSPKEFYKMKKGDILVCPFTDPEWSFLFDLASGVVSDTGSALSHAAIVTREYGIPSVLGVGFGTSRLHDGDIIKVDGNTGMVVKVKNG